MDCIYHRDLKAIDLYEIAKLKNMAWENYPIAEHMEWIIKNSNQEDLHFLKWKNGKLMAYMSLCNIEVIIDNKKILVHGSGNLCSENTGYGFLLMNNILKMYNEDTFIGFCRPHLINFYKHLGWYFPDKSKITAPNIDLEKYHLHTYNLYYNNITYLNARF